ncbi:hypothetical protein [Kribbella flavida]|uniref:hypothetical protein n=1 Tax=Kribbella flavida TaxID=182640 RepID=UPI00019BDD77|nr:hypothetical protein [Kribbella flavida]
MGPTLAGEWKAEEQPPASFPLADVCSLTNAADPNNQYSISLGVLPVSAQDAAELRKYDVRRLKGHYVVQPVDGGVGQDSWAVDPAAAGPWVVFRSGNRLVKVSRPLGGKGQLNAVKAVARTIERLPGGFPPTRSMHRRPECERGTAAAEKLLAAKAAARRDTLVNGFVSCRWASTRQAAVAIGGGLGSDAAIAFTNLRNAGTGPVVSNRRVPVGQEGWQQDNGFLAYQLAENAFVTVVAHPMPSTQSAGVLALARALRPIHLR